MFTTNKQNNRLLATSFASVVEKQAKQEEAAITVCGGLLGDNHIMGEMIESLMVDILASFDKKWYRQTNKHLFKESFRLLHDNLAMSKQQSMSDSQDIMDIADVVYDNVKNEYSKIHLATTNELFRLKLKYASDAAHMICIEALFGMVAIRYDHVIEQMKSIYSAVDYDNWYRHARFDDAAKRWTEAKEMFADKYIPQTVDPNQFTSLKTGLAAIRVHIEQYCHGEEVDEIRGDRDSEADHIYNAALRELKLVS